MRGARPGNEGVRKPREAHDRRSLIPDHIEPRFRWPLREYESEPGTTPTRMVDDLPDRIEVGVGKIVFAFPIETERVHPFSRSVTVPAVEPRTLCVPV